MPDDPSEFVPPVIGGGAVPAEASVWLALLDGPVRAGGAVPWLASRALDHLGDPDGERVDLTAGRPVAVPRLARTHVRVRGGDRVDFVQGQVSQDVRGLLEGDAADALLLDHKGRPRAGMTVYRRGDDLVLAIEDGDGAVALADLRAHVVFDDVTLDDVGEASAGPRGVVAFTLVSGDVAVAAEELRAALPELDPDRLATGHVVSVPLPMDGRSALLRCTALGPLAVVDVALLALDLREVWHALQARGVRPVGERAFTAARVAHGVATSHAEGRLGLPQETGLAGRVHPRKGCYLGQEIMARVEARGQVRRGLHGLALAGPPPALGLAQAWRVEDEDGRAIGEVGSAAPAPDGAWWALAVLRHDAVERAAERAHEGWHVVAEGDLPALGPARVAATLRAL